MSPAAAPNRPLRASAARRARVRSARRQPQSRLRRRYACGRQKSAHRLSRHNSGEAGFDQHPRDGRWCCAFRAVRTADECDHRLEAARLSSSRRAAFSDARQKLAGLAKRVARLEVLVFFVGSRIEREHTCVRGRNACRPVAISDRTSEITVAATGFSSAPMAKRNNRWREVTIRGFGGEERRLEIRPLRFEELHVLLQAARDSAGTATPL